MIGTSALVVAVIPGALAASPFLGSKLPGRFRERKCQGAAWRRAFPEASKNSIRDFLSMFVDAFAFKQSERLKLSPEYRILDIYRTIYPKRWMPDALEVETLAHDLERRFGFHLATVWSDQITMGQVFKAVHEPPAS